MLNSSHATIFNNWMSLRLIVRFSRFVCYMNFDVEVDLNVSMCNYTHRSLLQCVNIIDWLWLNSFQLAKYNLQIAIWLMLEFSVAILFVWKCVCTAFKWVQISMFEFCKRKTNATKIVFILANWYERHSLWTNFVAYVDFGMPGVYLIERVSMLPAKYLMLCKWFMSWMKLYCLFHTNMQYFSLDGWEYVHMEKHCTNRHSIGVVK